jgi:hypothetical protein
VYIGKVRYIDYSADEIDPFDVKQWFLHKRKEFDHEKELRAMVLTSPENKEGFEVPCDTSVLIEQICVGPTAPNYVFEVVQAVCDRFGCRVKPERSDLDTPTPFAVAIDEHLANQ